MWIEVALRRVRELEPEFMRQFRHRAVAVERLSPGDMPSPSSAVHLEEIEDWFSARGVKCRVAMTGSHLEFESIEITEPNAEQLTC
ncbi:MAG TPA: hypothetical protein VG734_25730 [Lacunisphaera sp.]|nr:hypothetical protein [Lacunisphaera sp.]